MEEIGDASRGKHCKLSVLRVQVRLKSKAEVVLSPGPNIKDVTFHGNRKKLSNSSLAFFIYHNHMYADKAYNCSF